MTNIQVSTLDEIVNAHTLGSKESLKFYSDGRTLTKEEALETVKQAKEAKTLVDQFNAIDVIVSRYSDVTDLDVLTEIRKFEPILRLIKCVNRNTNLPKSMKPTGEAIGPVYEAAKEFFLNSTLKV